MDRAGEPQSDRQDVERARTKEEIADAILAASKRRVAKHLTDEDYREVSLGLKDTTEHIAREYHGRVVLELIQNAHDALPKGRTDGRILLRLNPEEGEFGTLQVANSGAPFNHSNFEALRKVARSDKPPAEAIGNKGIGFKSVLEVTDSPAIFSVREPSSDGFDGYCFRFPRVEDLGALVEDPASQQQIAQEMLLLGLPIPTEPEDEELNELAGTGYVTVVSLPLRSQDARDEVASQIASVVDNDAPVVLFLDRVEQLRVATDTVGVSLTRSSKRVGGLDDARLVDLGPDGRYLVAKRSVPAESLKRGLSTSIERRLIDAKWKHWTSDATVAAAVRIDAEQLTGRKYTHLPMARTAVSPARAHLNAPFYANISRTNADEDIPFNGLLMDELCRCCIAAANSLRERNERWVPGAAVDLLSWDPTHADRWNASAQSLGVSMANTPLLPTMGPSGNSWDTFTAARRLNELDDERSHVITAEATAKYAGATLLRSGLGQARLDKLVSLGDAIGVDLVPTEDEIGGWVEAIARHLAVQPFRAQQWEAFYDDLDELDLGFDALVGRRILISDSSDLRATNAEPTGKKGRAKITFFLPSEDEDAAPLKVPASLRKDIAFMHGDIQWNLTDGRRRKRPGREYLERVGLVQEYRTTTVIRALRQILDRSKARPVHRDALRLAFGLFRSVPADRQQEFRRLPILLATKSKSLVPANRAIFSPAWKTQSGHLLAELIDRSAPRSPELKALRRRMLADPAPGQAPAADWHEFLCAIGVTDGLPLEPLNLPRSVLGRPASDRTHLGSLLGLSDAEGQRWDDDGAALWFRPETMYRFREPTVVLAGQQDHAALDDESKLLYARLLTRRLETAKRTDLTTTLVKVSNPNSEPQEITTPFHAFAHLAPWMPTRLPGQAEEVTFGPPAATWHHEGRRDRAPGFAALLTPEVGQELRSGPALERLRRLGLRVWDDPSDAWILVAELASIVASGVRPAHEAPIKNTYQEAWHHVVTRDQADPLTDQPNAALLIYRNGRLAARPLSDDSGLVLVPCRGHSAFDRLDVPHIDVLATDPTDGPDITAIVSEHLVAPVRRTDELDLEVTIGGAPIDFNETVPLLSDDRTWLPAFLLAAQRFNAGVFRPRTDRSTRDTFERLRATRVAFCESAIIRTDLANLEAPIRPSHPTLIGGEAPLLVATGNRPGVDTSWTWAILESLSRPLAELIREPEMANALAYSVVRIQRSLGAQSDDTIDPSVDTGILASALDLTIADIDEIRHAFQQAVLLALERLYPLITVPFGPEAAAPFDPDGTAISDESELIGAIAQIPNLGATWTLQPADIAAAVSTPTPWHVLAAAFDVDLAALNALLVKLGSPYRPDYNGDGQQALFDDYIDEHRGAISARLREAHLNAFRNRDDLADYAVARTVPLDADPAWVPACWTQSEAMMHTRLESWLIGLGVSSDLDRSSTLPPLDEVQGANTEKVWHLARHAAALRAWCAKHSVGVPDPWTTDQPGAALVALASAHGFLDFEAFAVDQVIEWFDHLGSWPIGMPHSVDLAVLELSDEDVATAAAGGSRSKPPPKVRIGDRDVVAGPQSYADLYEHLTQTLSASFLATPKRSVDLRDVEPGKRMPRAARGDGSQRKQPRDSDELKAFVGLAGEICALQWLQRQYRLDTDDCWVSEYRGVVRDDGSGDDRLGYDFRTSRKGQPDRYFEVKASRGDSTEFELTHNEAEVARTHTARRAYTILLVTNVLDDAERALAVLPNPYSAEGRARYRPTGTGIRYRFWRSS